MLVTKLWLPTSINQHNQRVVNAILEAILRLKFYPSDLSCSKTSLPSVCYAVVKRPFGEVRAFACWPSPA